MHIVHVEDDDLLRSSVKRWIESIIVDPKLTQFSNAEEALKFIHDNSDVNIVLSDYELDRGGGKLDGVDLATKLHDQDSKIPFVLMSAREWDDIQSKKNLSYSAPGAELPIAAYYHKPCKMRELIDTMNKLTTPRFSRGSADDQILPR